MGTDFGDRRGLLEQLEGVGVELVERVGGEQQAALGQAVVSVELVHAAREQRARAAADQR